MLRSVWIVASIVVSTSLRLSFRPSISRWMSSSRACVFSQQQIGAALRLADDAASLPPRRCALMSSASFCAVISVAFRFFSCSRCSLSDRFHPRDVLAQPIGFAERLLVVVGDRHQERRDLDLVEAAEGGAEALLSEVEGLTFMVASPRACPRSYRPRRGGPQSPDQADWRRQRRVNCGARRKSRIPTRTSVAPSSMATSKSWLIPIDSSASIDGSTPCATSSSRKRRERREVGPRLPPGRRPPAAAASARRAARRGSRAPASKIGGSSSGADAVLGRLARQIDLDQQLRRGARGRAPPRRAARAGPRRRPSGSTSNRAPAFRALFDCRWPTRCQRSGRSAVASIFSSASWTLFSPKSTWPAVGGGADVVGGEGFRNGDEADGGGVAPGPAGGARDAIANAGQPGAERGGIEHLLLELRDERLRGGARSGPSGASFRYVSNSVAAPARLPSFTSAMPS